jgi:hypothetical protein
VPRANPLHGDFWGDPDVGNYDPFLKLLFVFLFSSPLSTKSGVYVCSVKHITDATGIPRELVRHYLGIKELTREELREALARAIDVWLEEEPARLRNVLYDADNHTVFVRNMLARSLGGRPDKNAISIMGDHRRTYKSVDLWREFVKRYTTMLTNPDSKYYDADLAAYFENLFSAKVDGDIPEPIGYDVPAKTKRDNVQNPDYETEIQRMLNRYSVENDQGGGVHWRLDEEDRATVFRVLRHVTSNIRTGKQLSAQKRYQTLKRLDKEPTMLVARTCFLFEDGGYMKTGKRDNYLIGILNKSATSWFVEWKRELEKNGEFSLGSSKPKRKRRSVKKEKRTGVPRLQTDG